MLQQIRAAFMNEAVGIFFGRHLHEGREDFGIATNKLLINQEQLRCAEFLPRILRI
jgi:hypothetical protein